VNAPYFRHAFQFGIGQDKDGYFAYVPELKGCLTQGDTMGGVMKTIKEAIGTGVRFGRRRSTGA
jgi:predicted RNase H-like HicB family nuclease